jgi:Domain of unknown function (DUF4258)
MFFIMKKIIFTEHAKDRLDRRRISEDSVVSAIASPDFVIVRGEESEAHKNIAGNLLKVVYTEKERFIIIITLYRVNGDEAKDKV